jgi:hypothetical protein
MADIKMFPTGSKLPVYLNFDSFVSLGIDPGWQDAFINSIIYCCARWSQIGGADCRHEYAGLTTNTTPTPNQVLIQMNDHHADTNRLASTFVSGAGAQIVFHRKSGATLTPWNFVPYQANSGEFDMQAVLMHEFGHTYFLDHSPDSKNVMFGNYMWAYRFGPYTDDVARLTALYPTRTTERLRQLRTLDSGGAWSVLSSTITTAPFPETVTTVAPAVISGGGLYQIAWNVPGTAPSMTTVRGDGMSFSFRSFGLYMGFRPVGTAIAADDGSTRLWAGILDDEGTIRVLRSPDQGCTWFWASQPAGAKTYGAPGLCWTRVGGQSTWILVWSHFDRADQANSGFIRASTSTDNGQTWTTPVVVSTFLKALSGVSIAANQSNYIMLAVSRAPADSASLNTANTVWALAAAVVAGNLQGNVWLFFSAYKTPTQPAITFESGNDQLVMAFTEQNALSTLSTLHRPRVGGSWSAVTNLTTASNSAPALAANRQLGETVLWFVHE